MTEAFADRLVALAVPGVPQDDAAAHDAVVRLVYEQGLLAWAHDVAGARGWPSALQARLGRARVEATRRALAQVALLATLTRRAEAAGAPLLALKGVALSIALHGDPARRHAADLDVLVAPRDIGFVVTALRDLGFTPDAPWQQGSADDFLRWAPLHHEFVFRDSGGQLVEVHTRLTGPLMGRSRSVDALWQDRLSLSVGGKAVAMPSLEDTAPHLAVHGFCHGWERLAWIGDIAVLATRDDMDWDRARALAASLRCRTALDASLLVAHELFDTNVPHGVDGRARRAARAVVTRIGRGQLAPPLAGWLGDHFRSKDGWNDAARHAWRLWWTPAITDAAPGQWPPPWLALAWRRPLRLLAAHVGRRTVSRSRAGTGP